MSLTDHARRELELIGEEPYVIDWYCKVIEAFASYGHTGGSAMATIPVLHSLLQFQPLSPLTDDPDEWMDVAGDSDGVTLWQSCRNSEAFSEDGGRTYYLLSEREAAGAVETTPLHRSETRRVAP